MPTDMASQRVGPVSSVLLFFEEAVVHMMAQGHILDYVKVFDTDEPKIVLWCELSTSVVMISTLDALKQTLLDVSRETTSDENFKRPFRCASVLRMAPL